MDFSYIMSEDKIKKAMKEGDFDQLPGLGKPMKLDDMSGVPEELRMAYRILKNSGFTDEEIQLRSELMTIEDLIRKCKDETERANLQKQLNEKLLRFNQAMSKKGIKTNSAMFRKYEQKLNKKFK